MTLRINAIVINEHGATIVAAEGDHIEQHDVVFEAGAAPQQQAQAITESIDAVGSHDSEIVLAIPSMWCLAAAVDIGDNPRKSDEALGYRLEEHLPIAAEDFTADFAPPGSAPPPPAPEVLASSDRRNGVDSNDAEPEQTASKPSTRLGVCIQTSKLDPLITALENEGLRIGWICPAALLAGQCAIDTDSSDTTAVIITTNGHADVLVATAGVPTRWFITSSQVGEIDRILRAENLDAAQNIDDPSERIAAFATRIASGGGGVTPWVNLRRGSLAVGDALRGVRRPLTALLVAMILLLISAAGAMLWRAHNYNQLADDYYTQQIAILKNTLPHQRVLAAPRMQLASERKRLAGVHGSDDAPDLTASSLDDLVQLLEALPTKMRFRVLEMRLDPDRIIVDGQARSHGDADVIAQSLRTRGHFDVAPPRTQALKDGGVSFVLQMSPPAPEASRPGHPGGVEP